MSRLFILQSEAAAGYDAVQQLIKRFIQHTLQHWGNTQISQVRLDENNMYQSISSTQQSDYLLLALCGDDLKTPLLQYCLTALCSVRSEKPDMTLVFYGVSHICQHMLIQRLTAAGFSRCRYIQADDLARAYRQLNEIMAC